MRTKESALDQNTVSLTLIPKPGTVLIQEISVNQDGWGQDVSTVKKN